MDQSRANRILHIMKRLADITRVFNGEVDALQIELNELQKEDTNGTDTNDHRCDS